MCSPSYSPRNPKKVRAWTRRPKVQDNHGVDEMKRYVDYVISSELHAGDFAAGDVNSRSTQHIGPAKNSLQHVVGRFKMEVKKNDRQCLV